MARIDYYTQKTVQEEYFSDFLSSFDTNPLSNDLAMLKNENSIKQSVRNLVLTGLGERLFQPTVGGNIYNNLFEPFSAFAANDIKNDILNNLKQNESRILLTEKSVEVIVNQDKNQLTVNIFFSPLNSPDEVTVSLTLQRVR